MSKLSVIFGIYKNENNIMPFYHNFMDEIAPYIEDYEIIMVNDGSPDNSWAIMSELAEKDNHIKIVRLSRNYGAYEAVFTGYKYATGDCITVKGVDLQEPAELTVRMFRRWKEGAKVVLAVRESRNDSIITTFMSNLYYSVIRCLAQRGMPKHGFDIYLIDRCIADVIIQMHEKNSPITLQILWAGFDPVYESYVRQERRIGKSSWNTEKKIKLSIDSLINFSYFPIRFMTYIGFLVWFFSLAWGIYLIICNLLGKIDTKGYTTIVVLILFFAGMIMAMLGILGEYIWRILDNTRNRPMAVVVETKNI